MDNMKAATQQQTTESFMKQLEADTLSLLTGVEVKQTGQSMDKDMDEMEKGIQEAMTQKEERLKLAKMQIIEANITKLHAAVASEEKDLALAMVGLKELMEQIGLDYTDLTQQSDEEKAIVTVAESAVRQAEIEVEKAGQAWIMRTKKVAQAQLNLQNAKNGLEKAKTEANRLARLRLMNATLDKSLQHYITQVGRVVEIMTNRQKVIESQLVKVSQRRQQALKMKQEAATKMEELDKQLTLLEQQLKLGEDELAGLINGSPQHVAKESEVSTLRNQVEEVRGNRNTAFAIYNSKERFAAELQIHENAQRKLRDNQRIWIAVLKSDTQERLITFSSRLEAMKGMSDQQVAQGMDKIGTEVDGRNAEMLAFIGATSDKIRMEMFEDQPERVKRILNSLNAQAEAISQMREREQKAIEAYRERYGIDPKAASFFDYGNKG